MYSPPGTPFKGMPLELKTIHAVPGSVPVRESFVQGEAWERPAVVLGGGAPTLPKPVLTPLDNEIAVGPSVLLEQVPAAVVSGCQQLLVWSQSSTRKLLAAKSK